MAIAVTQRKQHHSNVDATSSYALTSVALTSGLFYVAFVGSTHATAVPSISSISGASITFTKRTTTGSSETFGGTTRRIECWYGMATGTATETVTVAFTGTTISQACDIYECTGVDSTGTNGANAIVQAVCLSSSPGATSNAVTLAAFASSDNRPLACCTHGANEVTTHDTGESYTELQDANHSAPVFAWCVQWLASAASTTPGFSWATSSSHGAIALELKAAAVAAGQAPRSMHQIRLRRTS